MRRTHARPAPGFRRGARIADLLTPDHVAFVESSIAAERTGDAATALDYHLGVPAFRRSAHRVQLIQLADVADEMTPWLWARWAVYQCTRAEDAGTASGVASRSALDFTVQTFHAAELEVAYRTGGDPVPIMARTVGEDWIYHQICTYELGGLVAFLDDLATGRLAEGAALARDWAAAPMGGHRVVTGRRGRLVVHDLAEDREVELVDLGAAAQAHEGWLLGRLIPSGTTPALMFDTRPVPVDERTAVEASTGERRGAWISALEQAFGDGRLDSRVTCSEDHELVSDIAGLHLLERGTPASALAGALDQLGRGRDEIGRAAYRILRDVAAGTFGDDTDAPFVAAAVLDPHGFAEAQRRLLRPEHRDRWRHWAELVAEPARGRLLRLATACR